MSNPGINLDPVEFAALNPRPLRVVRRRLDPQPELNDGVWYWDGTYLDWEAFNAGNSTMGCPFGRSGDLVRVLETWWSDDETGCCYQSTEYPATWWERVGERCLESCVVLRSPPPEWFPPSKMPRWASRYMLKIISVGIELHNSEWCWVIEVRSDR